jgi:hypothetical protein
MMDDFETAEIKRTRPTSSYARPGPGRRGPLAARLSADAFDVAPRRAAACSQLYDRLRRSPRLRCSCPRDGSTDDVAGMHEHDLGVPPVQIAEKLGRRLEEIVHGGGGFRPGKAADLRAALTSPRFLEERQDGATLQLAADEHLAGGINAVDLED